MQKITNLYFFEVQSCALVVAEKFGICVVAHIYAIMISRVEYMGKQMGAEAMYRKVHFPALSSLIDFISGLQYLPGFVLELDFRVMNVVDFSHH